MLLAGYMVLTPRILAQTNSRISIAHAFNYCELDTKRNIKTFRAVEDYVIENNLMIKYGSRFNLTDSYYPELGLNKNGLI